MISNIAGAGAKAGAPFPLAPPPSRPAYPPMSGNTIGRLFRLTTFGESHGPALGGILDGCPATG